MSTSPVWNVHIDGAARGNPGPAAFAYVIQRADHPPVEAAGRLGSTTNNVAEYTALVKALERAAQLGVKRLAIRSDSELLVKQMNGEYKVKNANLRELFEQARELCEAFSAVTIGHVRREQNKRADRLCNLALDGKLDDEALGESTPQKTPEPTDFSEPLRGEVLTFLQGAAKAWARGNPDDPDPSTICDRLWELLDRHGLVKAARDQQ